MTASASGSLPPGGRLPRRRWPVSIHVVVAIVIGMLVIGWALARFETHQLYYPTPLGGDTPSRWGLPYEEVRISTEDGETLHGWWCPQPDPAAPVLLFFHGNAGNREGRLHNLQGLSRAGIAVLIFDYRGYGGSSGAPSEEGLIRDGQAAYDWLVEKTGGKPIALFGRSLGGAVAAQTALRRPAARLILESVFTSVPDMARHLYPIPGLHHLVRTRFDTLSAMAELRMPLLIVHGTDDPLVPIQMGRTLFEASPVADKTFHAVQGGVHNDTYVVAGDDYYRWLLEFLGKDGR